MAQRARKTATRKTDKPARLTLSLEKATVDGLVGIRSGTARRVRLSSLREWFSSECDRTRSMLQPDLVRSLSTKNETAKCIIMAM